MTAFLSRMPAGIPGDVTRKQGSTVEVKVYHSSSAPTSYGVPVVLDSSTKTIRAVAGGDAQTAMYGFNVRPFPVSNPNTTDGLGTSTVNTAVPANVLRRGYINVKLNGSTAAADGGQVYVRTANASTGKPVGGVEAAREWGSSSAAKSGGNTGNGTCVLDATTPVASNAVAGVYTVRNIEVVTNGGKFQVRDPNGNVLGIAIIVAGAGGTVTFDNQVKFVLTDAGTDFALNDGFDITVVANTEKVPGAFFTGPADTDAITEVAYNV